jgi:hypothetical protein
MNNPTAKHSPFGTADFPYGNRDVSANVHPRLRKARENRGAVESYNKGKTMSNETSIDNGGRAFPQISPSLFAAPEAGMTLREYYAGQAMQGMLADDGLWPAGQLAERAVSFADALIAALRGKE